MTDEQIKTLAEQAREIIASNAASLEPKYIPAQPVDLDAEPLYDLYSSEPLFNSITDLSSPATFEKFQKLTAELILSDYQEEAFKLSVVLEDILYKYYRALAQQNPILYPEYEKLMALCQWVSITSFNMNEIESLVRTRTLLAMENKINVRQKLDRVLVHNYDLMYGGAIAEKLAAALGANNEMLGEVMIVQHNPEKELPPKASNWLNDYLISSHVPSDQQRTSYQRITYIEKSPNVLLLPKDQRAILYNFIKLYDWMAYGDSNVSEDESPEMLSSSGPPPSARPAVAAPEKIVTPPKIPKPNNLPEVKKVEMKEITPNQAPAAVKPSQPSLAKTLPPTIGPEVMDRLKMRAKEAPLAAGLTFGAVPGDEVEKNNSSAPVKSELPAKPKPNIDEKLEELKKRKK